MPKPGRKETSASRVRKCGILATLLSLSEKGQCNNGLAENPPPQIFLTAEHRGWENLIIYAFNKFWL